MNKLLIVSAFALLLAGCGDSAAPKPDANCKDNADQAACEADTACKWTARDTTEAARCKAK